MPGQALSVDRPCPGDVFLVFALLTGLCFCRVDAAAQADRAHLHSGKEEPTISIMAYNLKNFLLMERFVEGERRAQSPKPEAEIAAVIEIIGSAAPDILGVCEIGDYSQLEMLRGRLRTAGLDYPHVKHHAGVDAERHLGLLSRFPIIADNSRSDYSFMLGGVEERMQRGILDVTVLVGDSYRLRLVGVHLKSRRPVPQGEGVIRRNEAILLRRHLDAILDAEPGVNLLLFGDLNDTKDQPPVREIIGVRGAPGFMGALRLEDDRGERWTYYSEESDRYERLDFFLASAGLWPEIVTAQCRVVDHPAWLTASDHRPILAVIHPADR